MNKSYEVIDSKVIVYDEYYDESVREYTNNIEEILITENNIEEINELIEKEKKHSTNDPIEISSPIYLGLSMAQLILSILKITTNSIVSAIIHLFASTCFFSVGYFLGIKPKTKRNKIKKIKLNILEEKLDEEHEKLHEFNNTKSNDLMYVAPSKKSIDTSEQIMNLKRKLAAISSYEMYKTKFIRHYKKGTLREMMLKYFYFDDEDYYLIEELIKNDLSKKEEKDIGNQKVLKRI